METVRMERLPVFSISSNDLTLSIMPNRKAVVSPNSSHPFRASIAPMSFQCASRAKLSCP